MITTSPPAVSADYVLGADQSRFVYPIQVTGLDSVAGSAYTVQTNTASASWLKVDSSIGGTPGSLKITVDAGALSPGSYRDCAVITDASGKTLASVPVALRVRERPTLAARPTALTFSHQVEAPYPPTQTISVTGGRTQFSATASAGWIRPAVHWADSTITASTLRIDVNPSGLDPGTYTGSVNIRAADTTVRDLVVPVTLTVTPEPQLLVTPAAVSLEAQAGASQSTAANVAVDTNGEVLQVATLSSVPWLAAGPAIVSVGLHYVDGPEIVRRSAILGITADASSLSPGTYNGVVRLNVLGRSQTINVPVTLTVRGNDLIVPQLADGAGWKTSIVLANTDTAPAPFTIRFIGPDGLSLEVPTEGHGVATELSGVIPVGGSRTIETTGISEELKQGWAKVTAAKALTGSVVFRQRTLDGDSEAAVPVAAPFKNQISVPFDNADGFVTAMAIVNPTAAPVALAVVVRGENGQTLSNDSVFMGPESRKAFAISDQFPLAANGRGVITFTTPSGGELAGFALRFNPRHAFTAVQALPPAPAITAPVTRSVSQVADGGNWKTTIILVNNSQTSQPFSIVFRDQYGWGLQMPIVGIGPLSEYADAIPAGGLRLVESEGARPLLVQGSAEIVSNSAVMGTTIFRQRSPSGLDSEGAVQVGPGAGDRVVVPFDNTLSFITALAVMNESSAGNTIEATIRDYDGAIIATGSIAIEGHGRRAFAASAEFPAAKDRKGTIELSGSHFSALALRFNPRGAFTSIPPAAK